VFVDAAPNSGDDYIMPDLAHDTRQKRAFPDTAAMHEYAG